MKARAIKNVEARAIKNVKSLFCSVQPLHLSSVRFLIFFFFFNFLLLFFLACLSCSLEDFKYELMTSSELSPVRPGPVRPVEEARLIGERFSGEVGRELSGRNSSF